MTLTTPLAGNIFPSNFHLKVYLLCSWCGWEGPNVESDLVHEEIPCVWLMLPGSFFQGIWFVFHRVVPSDCEC